MTTDANHNPGSRVGRTARRIAGARIGRVPVGGLVAAIALVALVGAAYTIGTPGAGGSTGVDTQRLPMVGAPVAAGSASGQAVDGSIANPAFNSADSAGSGGKPVTAPAVDQLTAALETTQIVKTGSMALEVTDLAKAVSQAKAAIVGMGGRISQSSTSGDKETAVANVTYRLPAAKWDDALAALRGLAGRVISEQTDSTDVTAQVIDLDARLNNLQVTETALQSIMARASAIPDVLAVEQQLSQVEGQIEQLKAQRDNLKNQADMSTLSVSFTTPDSTVVTKAAQGWSLGTQVDEAGAALVHIGQGLATIVVWAVVVGLPIVIGLALLGLILWIGRRISGRRRTTAAA
jgi:hypothetical protein